jgi:dTDP-4-amino-4,6-dideoxygalactose transaminase
MREKGTNRSQFIRGEVDKYTWQDKGSSFLPGELTAAFLYSQLEEMEEINKNRLLVWDNYHKYLNPLETENLITRPVVPSDCTHNAHIYYFVVNTPDIRDNLLKFMKAEGVQCTSHYVPLHSSPAGVKYGRTHGDLSVTNKVAEQIIRLPLWPHMSHDNVARVVELLTSFFRN